MHAPQSLYRTAYRLSLATFRQLPGPLRRLAVRVGAPQFSVGAVCAVVSGNTVLLLRQRHREGWTLPGGLLDKGEDSEVAVQRELREELRLDLDPGLPVTTLVNPRVRRVDIIYRHDAGEQVAVTPRGEAVEAGWLRPDELGHESAETTEILNRLIAARSGQL